MKREYKNWEWMEYTFATDVITTSGVTGTKDDELTDTVTDDFDVL